MLFLVSEGSRNRAGDMVCVDGGDGAYIFTAGAESPPMMSHQRMAVEWEIMASAG